MKPNLSTTTLLIVDSLNIDKVVNVIERCKSLCDFADIKLLTHFETDYSYKVYIPKVESLVHYSVFMLKEAYKYIDTKHCLIVQRDGWIINPQSWNPLWEQYDYIGALFNQHEIMGVGGFSFRSRTLMESVSKKYPPFDGTNEHAMFLQKKFMSYYEDGEIAIRWKNELMREGFRFADLRTASIFAQGGNPNNNYHHPHPFGFHGSWRAVTLETGMVGKQIKYDGEVPVL